MPTVSIKGREIPYRIFRSRRNRHVRLTVSARNGLRISAPPGYPREDLLSFVVEKTDWIDKRIREYEQKVEMHGEHWTDGSSLLLFGDSRLLRVYENPGAKRLRAEFVEGGFHVSIPETVTGDIAAIRDLLMDWYRKAAHTFLPDRVRFHADRMGVFPSRMTIRNQRSRWGSCSAGGSINLNLKLMMLPPDVLDYVLVHELAHLVELNHSSRFWNIVRFHVPEQQEHRKRLRSYGYLLEL